MTRFVTLFIVVVLSAMMLTACGGEDKIQEPEDPEALLDEAATKIRSLPTFRMEIQQTGMDYQFTTDMGAGQAATVTFRRAVGQYVAPDRLQATVSILFNGMTIGVNVYGQGEDQWFHMPIFGWQHAFFAPGFNPAKLIADDSGIHAAMASLLNLRYRGLTAIDGTDVFHLSGQADGAAVSDLMVGLIEDEGPVDVDVFVDVDTHYPARIQVVQPDSHPENPLTWIVDFFDLGAEPELELPPDLATEETTGNGS